MHPRPPLTTPAVTLSLCALSACVAAGAGECPSAAPPTAAGVVDVPALTEASGLAASRRHPGVLWAHNDGDGNGAALLYALDEAGASVGTLSLPGVAATAVDLEDMAAAWVSGEALLVVGDIGDNDGTRDDIVAWVVAEPGEPGGEQVAPVAQPWRGRWPGGPRDAEALIVDPADGAIYVLSRTPGEVSVLRLPADGGEGEIVAQVGLVRADGSSAGAVRAADLSPDRSRLWLRAEEAILTYAVGDGEIGEALRGQACEVPLPPESQGEALAALEEGAGAFTLSEGASPTLWRLGLGGASP